jgi:hypothetical protein
LSKNSFRINDHITWYIRPDPWNESCYLTVLGKWFLYSLHLKSKLVTNIAKIHTLQLVTNSSHVPIITLYIIQSFIVVNFCIFKVFQTILFIQSIIQSFKSDINRNKVYSHGPFLKTSQSVIMEIINLQHGLIFPIFLMQSYTST